MAKKFPNLLLGLLLVVVLAVATLQGRRVDHLRDCDRFYRWIISASTQVRIFGIPGTVLAKTEDNSKKEDYDLRLFHSLVEKSDAYLEDVPVSDTDYDKDGNPYPKVVRYTAAPPDPNAESSKVEKGHIESAEQVRRDWKLWQMAQSKGMAPLRGEFLTALREGKLTSSGSQFNLSGMYEEHGTTANLANMFLGFRKMAANLIWLQIDKLWHKGAMYQMIPLMRTCVTLDPTFVDAFLVGAWHLSYNIPAKLDITPYELRTYHPEYDDWLGEREDFIYAGVEFLKDGIRKNPREYKLYFDLGFAIYEEKLNNIPKAIEYLSEAIRLDHDRWVRRQLYRELGKDGRLEESKAGWESYLEWQPKNQVAKRFISLMDGAIKERNAEWASDRARAAEKRAELARQHGNDAVAQDWDAKAEEARTAETEGYKEARAYWQKIVDESNGEDTYALARVLLLNAREKVQQKRYVEAIVDFDNARWASDQFWKEATDAMVQTKLKDNEPLSLTEKRQLEREKDSLQYIRHLPQSIGGEHYRFDDGTWYQETRESRGEPKRIPRDSAEMYELIYRHPQITKALDELDGNIVLQAGDTWYSIDSPKPAVADKLYTPPAA